MNYTLRETVETILTLHVRPALASHQGNVDVVSITNGVLRIRLTGKCSTCPSAQLTSEEWIASVVTAHIPEIKQVTLVTGVSDSLISQARQLLHYGHL